MNAQQYLTTIVEPTIAEFEAEPTSVRRAFLASVVTFDTIDYLHLSRQKLRSNPDFAIVDAVAHALKHVKETSHRRLGAAQVISRPPAHWGEAAWDLSRFDDCTGGVTVDDSRRDIDLLTAVRRTCAMLSERAGK